jgi:hypothetical protein
MSYPINGTELNMIAGYASGTDQNGNAANIVSITASVNSTTGTATIPLTPSDLKKWGNVKFDATFPVGGSVKCAILDSSNNVLKADVTATAGTNYLDISDISATTYPSIKAKVTLNRVSTSDTTPSIKESTFSVTQERKLTYSDGAWEKVAETTLGAATAQVDFTSLSTTYKGFKIQWSVKSSSTSSTRNMVIKFNDITGSYYFGQELVVGNTTVSTQNNISSAGIVINNIIPVNTGNSKYCYGEITIQQTTSAREKTYIFNGATSLDDLTTGQKIIISGGAWKYALSLITKISLIAEIDSFISGSRFTLWGYK